MAYGFRMIDEALSAMVENCFPEAIDKITQAGLALSHAESWEAIGNHILIEQWFTYRHSRWGRKGANAKADKYAPVKDKLFCEYRSRKWPSAHAASFALSELAMHESKKQGRPLSSQRVQKTVHSWLKEYDRENTASS